MDASCNKTYDKDNKAINTPNYPRWYPEPNNCTWNITVPIGFEISVEPFSYALNNLSSLKIYDGSSNQSRKVANLRGENAFSGTTSTFSNLFVEFESFWGDNRFQTKLSLVGT